MKVRPKRTTQSANTRFPAIFSNSLVEDGFKKAFQPDGKYLVIFLSGMLHVRLVELKTFPRIFLHLAGD